MRERLEKCYFLSSKLIRLYSFGSKTLLALMVCMHGGHVGGQEQYDFSSLGVNCHFYANYVSKFSFVLSTNMAAMQTDHSSK